MSRFEQVMLCLAERDADIRALDLEATQELPVLACPVCEMVQTHICGCPAAGVRA